jgi:putative modified peptide
VANKLSEKTVDALLDKLSSDDGFRERFQENPREATRSLGTNDPAVDSLPEEAMPRLADKRSLSTSRGKFRATLLSASYPFQPIHLEMPDS